MTWKLVHEKLESVVWFILDHGLDIVRYTLLLSIGLFFIFYGLPAIQIRQQELGLANRVVSVVSYSFNDIVVMVSHNYGFWGGLGGITQTSVTFQNGLNATRLKQTQSNSSFVDLWLYLFQPPNNASNAPIMEDYTVTQFAFSGNLDITAGSLYQIDYRIVTYGDNNTEIFPVSIVRST